MMLLANDAVTKEAGIDSVEQDFLNPTGGRTMLWCGRGATALYFAFRVAAARRSEVKQPEVILPAISCATVANAALLAGLTPRFADTDAVTGLVSLDSIKARWTSRTCAVVFIHLFGQTADLRALAAWCRTKNVLQIEDAAQALGAILPDGRPVGAAGEMTVYSFNRTKILECGGGALLVRCADCVGLLNEQLRNFQLPELEPERAAQLELGYRNLHHALVSLLRLREVADVSELFLRVRPAYEKLYLRGMQNLGALSASWPSLAGVLERRRQKASLYSKRLGAGPWQLLDGWRASGVCWRYSLLVNFPEQLVSCCEMIRRDGFHVSNLYWPVNSFFRPRDFCPVAESFARRIVNLWVDDNVDTNWVERCVASVQSRAQECAASHDPTSAGTSDS
jgi:dTDP-4-amino-4,6-dideoxygalactose transaminase